MIASMFNLDPLKQSIIIVVIERDNLDRMKKADPITLESTFSGGFLPPPRYPANLSLLMAYEEDQDELYRLAKQDPMGLLKWLERGRVFIEGVDGKSTKINTREYPPDLESILDRAMEDAPEEVARVEVYGTNGTLLASRAVPTKEKN